MILPKYFIAEGTDKIKTIISRQELVTSQPLTPKQIKAEWEKLIHHPVRARKSKGGPVVHVKAGKVLSRRAHIEQVVITSFVREIIIENE